MPPFSFPTMKPCVIEFPLFSNVVILESVQINARTYFQSTFSHVIRREKRLRLHHEEVDSFHQKCTNLFADQLTQIPTDANESLEYCRIIIISG